VYKRCGCIAYRSIGADPVELDIPKLRRSDVSFQKSRREVRRLIGLIDASLGSRLSFDAYLYVVEVLLLPDIQVGRCGRGEGRLVGEDLKTVHTPKLCNAQ
jgi:hypothetical protein